MKVSVIIVNFNGKKYINECIDSVLDSSFKDFEVVMVENGSTDGSWQYLKERYGKKQKVMLVKLKENLFFAGGSNLGAKKAKGEWVIFLNSDTVVDRDFIKEMVKVVGENKKRLVQPKIKIYKTDKIDCVIGKYSWPGFGKAVGRGKKDNYKENIKGDYVNGTCFMVSKKFFFELNGFDEDFKFFYEDVDFSLRAKKTGGKAWGAVEAVIEHKGSLSFKQNVAKDKVVYYYRRNRLLTILKNFKGLELLARVLGLLIMSLFFGKLKVTVKAYGSVINMGLKKWFNLIRIKELTRVVGKKKYSLLDLGCGDGELINLAEERKIKAKGIDKVQGMMIEKLKLKQRFNVVSLYHVLEHIKEPEMVLEMVKKWLKKQGILVIEVPIVGNLSEKWLGKDYLAYMDKTHKHFWTKNRLFELLKQNGWRVKKQGVTGHQFPFTVITSSFRKGIAKGLLGTGLWLPLKLLSILRLNEEMVRLYCVKVK